MLPKRIGSFLDKFTHLTPPDNSRRKAVAAAVEGVVGITVPITDITVKGKTAYVSAPAPVKSEIMLHQSEVLTQVRSTLGEKGGIAAIR